MVNWITDVDYKTESYVVFITQTPEHGRYLFVCSTFEIALAKAKKWVAECVPTPLYIWHKIVTPTKITLEYKAQVISAYESSSN